ncbi:MAG: hypothetical protein GF329_03770 [Candidatus Lokiarchaeota archaeon]|nr:hypothetical protein [Candidatus Lokiarchaeota archaeon]
MVFSMTKKYELTDFFSQNSCDLCGLCLERCPVLNYEHEKAKSEMKKLINKIYYDSEVVKKCQSCFSCNLYCPNECNPYELVLYNWYISHEEKGIPSFGRIVFPNQKLNLWNSMYYLISEEERQIIDRWKGELKGDILLTGCFTQIFPYLTKSELLDKLKPRGTECLWCNGGHIYQLGLFNIVNQIGKKSENNFKDKSINKIITFMEAEFSMLERILPKFGYSFDHLEVETLTQWLLNEIKGGEIELKKRLNFSITIHDNCFAKENGTEFCNLNRKLAKKTGVKLIEMDHNKENALCCGFGAGSYSYSVFSIMKQAKVRFEEAKKTGANALVVYCSACLFILSAAKQVLDFDMPIFHIFELVQMSAGERPIHNWKDRAWNLISIFTYQLIKTLLSKRFKLASIEKQEPDILTEIDFKILKLMDYLFKNSIVKKSYVNLFKIINLILKRLNISI